MPFLPLERKHIEECIRSEFKKFTRHEVDQGIIDNIIMRFVAFDKNNMFATNGCKNLDKKVDMEAGELMFEYRGTGWNEKEL